MCRLASLPGVSASEEEVVFDFVQFEELSRRIQQGDPKPKVPELSSQTKEHVAGFLYATVFRIHPADGRDVIECSTFENTFLREVGCVYMVLIS